MEEFDELDKYIDDLINAELSKLVTEEIGPYTCQFLKQDPKQGIAPFASGVLAELGGSYYILTASHVIEDWSDTNRLFIEIDGNFISIAGRAYGTEVENQKKIDVAYIKLKEEIILLLKVWYKFLPISRFLNHRKLLSEANYCVFGYPVANPKNENQRTIGAAYYVRPNQDKVFWHYGYDPLSHYVLEFVGKAVNFKTGSLEKIRVQHYGLSGCGLWYTTIKHDGKKFISKAQLIGIMTEFKRGKYDCLIANRIEIILALLQEIEGLKIKQK